MRPCRGNYALWATIIVLGLIAMLSGCGAKGDLYHPSTPPQQTATP